jgi:hypothetical protein
MPTSAHRQAGERIIAPGFLSLSAILFGAELVFWI